MNSLYEIVDQITAIWILVEKMLKGTPFKDVNCKLSIERTPSGQTRLCYNGRPIVECKAEEKIDAVDEIDKLGILLQEHDLKMVEKAERARKNLSEWLVFQSRETA